MISTQKRNACEYSCAQISKMEELTDFLKPFGITHFAYNKLVGTDQYLALHSLLPWVREKFGCSLDRDNIVQPQLDEIQSKHEISLWQGFTKNNQLVKAFGSNFNIGHGIALFNQVDKNVHEIFHFAGDKDNEQMINFYINNLSFLKAFSTHFTDKLSDLIDHRVPGRLLQLKKPAILKLPNTTTINSEIDFENTEIDSCQQNHLSHNSIYLTKKEQQCFQLLKQGYSNKQMALYFGNSPRTIEEIASNIMRKLKVNSRKEFITLSR